MLTVLAMGVDSINGGDRRPLGYKFVTHPTGMLSTSSEFLLTSVLAPVNDPAMLLFGLLVC